MANPEEISAQTERDAGHMHQDSVHAVGGVALLDRQVAKPDSDGAMFPPDSPGGYQFYDPSDTRGLTMIPMSEQAEAALAQISREGAQREAEEEAHRQEKDEAWRRDKLPELIERTKRLRAVSTILKRENPVVVEDAADDNPSGHFTGEDYVASVELASIFSEVAETGTDRSKEIGLTTLEHATIEELNSAVQHAAQKTAKKLRFQTGKSERAGYAQEETAREQGVKSFEKQLRYLVCRTIQTMDKAEPNSGGLLGTAVDKKATLLALLLETPQLVEDVYATDIPLYEKMLADFDRMRQNNPDMLEVYLARDGVFAYYGRRAQAAVRRGLLDPATRREMRESGEVTAYIPKYKNLLINRRMIGIHDDERVYFDDNFSLEQQQKADATIARYLKQEGLEGEDVHFFDTGFDGSIPETIMEALGYTPEEINQRIHMVSANDSRRRSRGLRVNHRRAALKIEHNRPKLTSSAEGFAPEIEDQPLRAVTRASSAEDAFKSLVIREAIHRHFWVRERKLQQKRKQ